MKKLLLIFLFSLFCISCGKPEIAWDCTMNGFGAGECRFTNKGDGKGAVCGHIEVKQVGRAKFADPFPQKSGEFCSGEVAPKSTETVGFQVTGLDFFCRTDDQAPEYWAPKKWSDVCAFGFFPDAKAAEKTAASPPSLNWDRSTL